MLTTLLQAFYHGRYLNVLNLSSVYTSLCTIPQFSQIFSHYYKFLPFMVLDYDVGYITHFVA